jgi:aspartate-semialdehyde dehydrogenase
MYNVAIVGATGIVGRQLVELLEERNFPLKKLKLFASENSLGNFLDCNGDPVAVQLLDDNAFDGADLVFFCAGTVISEKFCPTAAQAGAICIDCSGFWNSDVDVPVVVPEVNPEAVADFRAKRIVANPSCATILLSLPLQALRSQGVVRRVVVTTYQPVSVAGQKGVDELRTQSGELLNGRPATNNLFPQQIAFNCVPQVGAFMPDGNTTDELALINELDKIFADDDMRISTTAVYVPIFYGICQAVNLETVDSLSVGSARELIAAFPGLELVDDNAALEYPLPVTAAGQDAILVGRIRSDQSVDNGLNLWLATDNLRKGLATNAVQIAELLSEKYL